MKEQTQPSSMRLKKPKPLTVPSIELFPAWSTSARASLWDGWENDEGGSPGWRRHLRPYSVVTERVCVCLCSWVMCCICMCAQFAVSADKFPWRLSRSRKQELRQLLWDGRSFKSWETEETTTQVGGAWTCPSSELWGRERRTLLVHKSDLHSVLSLNASHHSSVWAHTKVSEKHNWFVGESDRSWAERIDVSHVK